jgi:hypothetical protein
VEGLFWRNNGLKPIVRGKGRVGAVLNARNRGDLEEAVRLINGVLERAKKEEENGETFNSETAPSDLEDIAASQRAFLTMTNLRLKLLGEK